MVPYETHEYQNERSNLVQPECRFHDEGSQSNYRRLPDGLRRGVEKVVKGWFSRVVEGGRMIPIYLKDELVLIAKKGKKIFFYSRPKR